MQIGSDEHKELFCRWFIDTHRVYEPEDLPWPELDQASLDRLRSVPIWSHALAVEHRAGELVTGFASTQEDPLVREAIAVQGIEEDRHGRILGTMMERYGLTVEPIHLPFDTREETFVEFGYKECLDAFMGYGAFRIARDAEFMPEPFLSIFVDFMAEETRHIVFFVNWIAYQRARQNLPLLSRISGTALGYLRAFGVLAGTVKSANNDSGFMGGGEAFGDLSPMNFLRICLRENDKQMGQFNSGLLRPRVIPTMARVVLGSMYAAEVIHRFAHAGEAK